MEVEVTVKQGLEKRRHLKRQVSIQDEVFVNRIENEEDDVVFLNRPTQFEHTRCAATTFRRPLNHRSLKKAKSLNQTIFKSHQTGVSFESGDQGDFGWILVGCIFLVQLITSSPLVSNFNLLYLYLKTKVFPNHYTEILGCLNKISGHLASPILTILVFNNYKALRLFAVLGCMMCSLTLLFSAFSFQFHQFVLSFSLMNGVFSELVKLCSVMIIIQYFKRKLWLVEMIILLSNGFSYSLFSILIHFIFSEYSWRKSLQLLSLLTSSSLILALFFFRPASIYHPQRRAILHLKEQQRQKFKQRLPNRKVNVENTYKLSNHFRQQSLEIGTRYDANTNKTSDRNGSVSSAISGSNASGLNGAGLNNSAQNSSTRNSSGNLNSNETNSLAKSNTSSSTNPTASSNGQSKQSNFKSKQTEDQRTFSSSFSSFFFQRQATRQQISFNKSLFTSFNKRCLNSFTKLTRSSNLIEYLDLLKSRDFKFIIMSAFLSSFVQIYLSIQYNDDRCSDVPSNVTPTSSNVVLNQKSSITRSITKNVLLINSINLVSLSKVNLQTTTSLDLMCLNIYFGLGYCIGLVVTSALVSHLYLTSKSSSILAFFGSSLNVIMISMLNTCLVKDNFELSDSQINLESNLQQIDIQTSFSSVSRLVLIKLLNILKVNVYTIQIIFYVFYGYFQAELDYSIRLLLIERYSKKKLLRAISLHSFIIGLGHLFLLLMRFALNYLNHHSIGSNLICINKDCGIFISNFIIICSTIVAIILLNFISNRSINRFRRSKKTVVKKSCCFSRLFFVFESILNWFKIFRFLRILTKFVRFNRLIRTKLVNKNSGESKRTNCENRFRYKKQLSESNLKDVTSSLNQYNGDLHLLKSLEESICDLKSNYLIDCFLCGKCYIVHLDLKRIQLVELCSIDELKTNEIDQLNKMNEIDEITDNCDKIEKTEK